MQWFIDFDRVLFDYARMLEDIYADFGDLSAQELDQLYKAFRKTADFSIEGFAQFLSEKGHDGEKMAQLFRAYAPKSREYLYSDAQEFLGKLRAEGHALDLLTFAHPDDHETWQKPKVAESGLVPYFARVHVTDQPKHEVVAKLSVDEPFTFIDDKASAVEKMCDKFPNSRGIVHVPGESLLNHL